MILVKGFYGFRVEGINYSFSIVYKQIKCKFIIAL